MVARVPTGLLTDRYEFTMLGAALRDGTAQRRCTFEVFARRLPNGRRYGVVAGTLRLLSAITDFRPAPDAVEELLANGVVDDAGAEYLASYRFGGDVDGYREGELYFPYSPLLTVSGTFAECVVLETLCLSVLNHDSAIASAAARMVSAAAGRPIIEMGSRRTHELAAIASARAAYIAGFASTSNLAAGRVFGVPTAGTAAHAFTLLHDDELGAFRAQIAALGPATTLLVDTFDITKGIENAVAAGGPSLGAIRIDSGDLGVLARQARAQLDGLGATGTRIVVSGDLDEYAIAALAAAPVDIYGAGTAVVTGSGAPTAGFVVQARRRRRPAGRETIRAQGEPRRTKVCLPGTQADRNGDRGGRRLGSARGRCPRRARPGPPRAATSRRKARGRAAGSRRLPGAPTGRHGHLALGRPEALPRRAGDPHPHGLRASARQLR
jgi:nicotinate phosphoribosyltransferase